MNNKKHGPGTSLMRLLQLEEMRQMSAEELLKKYHMVVYSEKDLKKINLGLCLIQEVLNRNSKLLEKEVSNG